MDIAALSVLQSQASIKQSVGLALTKLVFDKAQENSDAMTKMMELSVNPNVGSNFDKSI